MAAVDGRKHTYHAHANLLNAELEYPLQERVRPQAYVKLFGESHYHCKYADPFRLEGIMSYRSGYTHVGGHRSSKPGSGFVTLTTSVVEGVNILEVLTADRVVAQISTEHPPDGAVPSVSFLGTRFENLRIAGHKLEIDTNLDILGPKPADDRSYLDERSVIDRMRQQYEHLSSAENLPDWATKRFPRDRAVWQEANQLHCSLVNSVTAYPGTFGHIIDVPHFGKIFLAELKVERAKAVDPHVYDAYTFSLSMIRMELGSPVIGRGQISALDSNGTGGKP